MRPNEDIGLPKSALRSVCEAAAKKVADRRKNAMNDYIALADKLGGYANGDEFQRPVEEAERVIRALSTPAADYKQGESVSNEVVEALRSAQELVSYLWSNVEPSGDGGNIELIAHEDVHADQLAALLNDTRERVDSALHGIEIAALSVAPAQDREDAQRYRWLKLNAEVTFDESQHFSGIYSRMPSKSELDAAVDAARQAPKEPGPGCNQNDLCAGCHCKWSQA